MVTNIQICSTCKEGKTLSDFHKNKNKSNGHTTVCKSCARAKTRIWNKNNVERKAEAGRKWHTINRTKANVTSKRYKENNIERVIEIGKAYYRKNKETLNKSTAIWKRNNKDKVNATGAKRRAKQKQAIPLWFEEQEVKHIYKIAKEKNLVVDHIIPLNNKEVCGLHTQDNLRCIPEHLNLVKSNRYWPDMWDETKAACTLIRN